MGSADRPITDNGCGALRWRWETLGSMAGEVYFEHRKFGTAVRVAAIDGRTGIEVTVVGPASAAAADLERLALSKLRARLARHQSEE